MTIGQFLRSKRESLGITQEVCASVLGFAQRSNYHKLESGKLEWKLRDIVKMAKLFGQEPDELLKEWRMKRES